VLILLASYGATVMCWFIFITKIRKTATTEPRTLSRPTRVTVQLPIFNEQFVVERLLERSAGWLSLDKLDIQVLDDLQLMNRRGSAGLVNHYAAQGFPVTYHIVSIAKDSRRVRSPKD